MTLFRFRNLFAPKDPPVNTCADFWKWFSIHEQHFYKVIRSNGNIEKEVFGKILPKLEEWKEGVLLLAGMYDDNTAEIVFTADGIIPNIVFAEELAESAPALSGWKFTALKQGLNREDFTIKMSGYVFNTENISFYAIEDPAYPDDINITLVYEGMKPGNEGVIANGTLIFLDNYIGELNLATQIDQVKVIGPENASQPCTAITKLKDYLHWREKEFTEKYESVRRDTENDHYAMGEMELENGLPQVVVFNNDLLKWDRKASHPWIAEIDIPYKASRDSNGMPDETTLDMLNRTEEELTALLPDAEGYLNICRQTGNHSRVIYFACRDFRKPSKVLHYIRQVYSPYFSIDFNIYIDKYWRTFDGLQH